VDPKRLLAGDATDFERNLLDAVRKERPAPVLEEGIRRALGLPEAVVTTTKTTLLTWGKATLLGVVTAGGLAAGTLALQGEQPAPALAAAQKVDTAARPSPLEPEPAPAEVQPPPEPKRATRPATSSAARDLREEIRLLDQVRAALSSGSHRRALSLLSAHAERFPRGTFRQEAGVLRMEALDRSGDKARARALATKFLADHPKSPHVERVRRIAK
jgi:TolA-binding protein